MLLLLQDHCLTWCLLKLDLQYLLYLSFPCNVEGYPLFYCVLLNLAWNTEFINFLWDSLMFSSTEFVGSLQTLIKIFKDVSKKALLPLPFTKEE